MAPVIRAFQADARYQTRVCVTGQHRTMLDQVLEFFTIQPDEDLDLMTPNQSLAALAAKALTGCRDLCERLTPDVVFVQGDTTTAFAAAFAAFLQKIPVAHIEAGLRSHQKLSPFPEEINRVLISDVADLHFAPLEGARENLRREGITENVFVVGNTVVDALLLGLQIIRERGEEDCAAHFPALDFSRPLVLVTVHRRESFGTPLEQICRALLRLARAHPDTQLVYPMHLNPNVRETVCRLLGDAKNIHLIEPLAYSDFIWMMSKAALIITDSGGVQEEAPSLNVPVLIVREVTERNEGVAAGCAQIVGTDEERIFDAATVLLKKPAGREAMVNPYGDGQSSQRILEETSRFLQLPARS